MPFIISRPLAILLISFWLLSGTAVWAKHKFYLSTTKIDVSRKGQSLDCDLQFFRDDFELALEEKGGFKVSLEENSTDSTLNAMVREYVMKRFSILQENKELEKVYLGFESNEEYVIIYIGIAKPKKGDFFVKNSCLHELFDGQKNVINFQFIRGGDTQSELLLRHDESAAFIMPG